LYCKDKLIAKNYFEKCLASMVFYLSEAALLSVLSLFLAVINICDPYWFLGKRPQVISKFYYQLMHKRIALKGVLKFTLKQLQHVWCDHHHQGAHYVSFLKLQC
jgi:hypothetical protein